jgi:lipopolysaccharide biosynthesis protein
MKSYVTSVNKQVRVIAFYLPQFHPVPENDEWWGKGFTEWRNVTKAKPLFSGHYQPHQPADLGYYDLRLPDVRVEQANLARQYGIHGFCYYHYWFNGRRILERPFTEVLASGQPDFPFCICWANENWARTWDGGDTQILLAQEHSEADDYAHIQALIPALRDHRYIRIDGRPLLLIYRPQLLPDPGRTARIWRDAVREAGLGELYLAGVEKTEFDPDELGFNAVVEFSPNSRNVGARVFNGPVSRWLSTIGILPRVFSKHSVFPYSRVVAGKLRQTLPDYKYFRCVAPGWDNTARRTENGRILIGSSPSLYQQWLQAICTQTMQRYEGDERIVFINAWNEWAEGCHLEPDLRWGNAYLQATQDALTEASRVQTMFSARSVTTRSDIPAVYDSYPWRRWYWTLTRKLREGIELARAILRLPV